MVINDGKIGLDEPTKTKSSQIQEYYKGLMG
jgi:hypothetical protein